jgi:pyruvate kinase
MLTQEQAPTRKTKVAVTIGPSCRSPEMLERMVDEGMDIARFKFSHGTPSAHTEVIGALRKVSGRVFLHPLLIRLVSGPGP